MNDKGCELVLYEAPLDLCLGGSNSMMVNDMHTLQRTHSIWTFPNYYWKYIKYASNENPWFNFSLWFYFWQVCIYNLEILMKTLVDRKVYRDFVKCQPWVMLIYSVETYQSVLSQLHDKIQQIDIWQKYQPFNRITSSACGW